MKYILLIGLALFTTVTHANIENPRAFIGEVVLNGVKGAPLITDTNGKLASGLQYGELASTASFTIPTTTDALVTGMTFTPVAGTYLIIFSTDVNSASAGAAVSVSTYIGGTQDADSLRKIIPFSGGTLTSGSARAAVSLNGIYTVNGSQAIEIRSSTSNAGPTMASKIFDYVRLF